MLTFVSEWIMDMEGVVESTVDIKSTFLYCSVNCIFTISTLNNKCEGLWWWRYLNCHYAEISRSLTMGIKVILVPRKWNSEDDEMNSILMETWRGSHRAQCPHWHGTQGSCQSCQPGNWSVRLIKDRVTGLILSNCYLTLTITRVRREAVIRWIGAFSVILKTDCETDGSSAAEIKSESFLKSWPAYPLAGLSLADVSLVMWSVSPRAGLNQEYRWRAAAAPTFVITTRTQNTGTAQHQIISAL